MAKRKTRRTYRRFFRGTRVYLPLIFLLFTVMVLFLPLSAGWMALRAEKEIARRTGIPVKIERLEITLAEGKVEVIGLSIQNETDTHPFRIRRVELDGTLAALLGGNEAWPSQVVVDGLPPLLVEKNQQGIYELRGAFRSLLDELSTTKKIRPAQGSDSGGESEGGRIGRTPRVVMRSVPISVDPIRSDLPVLAITMDEIVLDERPTGESPFRVALKGIALADSLERFSLAGLYLPSEKRIALEGTLSGVALPFVIPQLGDFTTRAKDLVIDLNGRQLGDGRIDASLNAKAGFFEVVQDRLGGERWEDEPVELRLRAEFQPADQSLHVGQLSLSSAAAKIDLKGDVTLTGDLPGVASIQVERLPRGAIALLQNELTDRMNVTIEADDTSPTLTIEGSVDGSFARPEEMNSFAAVHAMGWRINSPKLPSPVVVRSLDIMASRNEVEVRDLQVGFAGFEIHSNGTIPICAGDSDRVGEIFLSAEGNTEAAFDFLSRKGITPNEINYARLPVSLDVKVQGRVDCDDPIRPKVMTPRIDGIAASLTWKVGEIGLRDFSEPIRLEPGRAVYKDSELSVERFSASSRNISVKADGKVKNLPTPFRPGSSQPVIDGSVSCTGEIPDLISLLNQHLTLPTLPRDISGQYQLTVTASADTAALAQTDYNVRLLIDKASATVDTPFRPVHVADFSTEMNIDRNVLEIRRGSVRVVDEEFGDSTIGFKASVDHTAIRADVDARTHLELLPALLPMDLRDMYMKGTLAASGWGRFTPRTPLPDDKSVAEAWIAFLKKPGLTVNVKGDPDLMADFEISNRQEGPVEIFPRDFPVRITNVRGGAKFTPKGILLNEVRADFGSAKDVLTSGSIVLGRPVRINFNADIGALDVNEWTSGWGEREWAAYSASFEPRWKSIAQPYQMAVIDAHIKASSVHFMRYDGEKIEGDLHFESWSRIPSELSIKNLTATMYGGPSRGELLFDLIPGQSPVLTAKAQFSRADLKSFMNALYGREQKMDGLITGDVNFQGQMMNYPTYKADARYSIEKSGIIGNVILDYARNVFQMTSTTGLRDSTVTGSVNMYDQKVFLPDFTVKNPNINLTADGYVDFRGRLFFDVTASVIAKRLKEIPVIRIIGEVVDMVGNQIMSYEVRGNLSDPKYRPVLTPVGRLLSIRELMRESQKEVIRPEQEQSAPLPPAPAALPDGKK